MKNFTWAVWAALVAITMAAPAGAATVSESFTGATRGSDWLLVQDAPTALWLDQTGGRLELRSAGGGAASNDALYLSAGVPGIKLNTANDFALTIDYNFSGFTASPGGTIALALGIGRDLAGTDSAAIAFARSSVPFFDTGLAAAYRVDDVETQIPIAYAATSGTLSITYTSATDRLTLGDGTNSTNLDGLVRGQWAADDVYVSFGGRGSGLSLASGEAYLDNFSATPEPATLALLILGGAGALLRRRYPRA